MPLATDTRGLGEQPLRRPPIWSCSGRGLPGRPVTRPPVGSYPTFSPLPDGASPEINAAWRFFSVALSFGSPRLGITQRPALWSPDFPPTRYSLVGGHPSASARGDLTLGSRLPNGGRICPWSRARRASGWRERPLPGCARVRHGRPPPRQ